MKRPGKRAQRRNRGRGLVRHLDGIWRQPKKTWAIIARHQSGRAWFVWMLTDEKTAWSPKIARAIEEAFEADTLTDPETDIPIRQVE